MTKIGHVVVVYKMLFLVVHAEEITSVMLIQVLILKAEVKRLCIAFSPSIWLITAKLRLHCCRVK